MADRDLGVSPLALVEIVRRLLRVGVPPTAIANAFEMDPDPIREVAVAMRREQYGTAELAEANSFLTWKAYEESLRMISHGSPDVKLKAAMQVMSKALAVSARQTPEDLMRARADFARLVTVVEEADEEAGDEALAYEQVRADYVIRDAEVVDDAGED